MKKSTAMEKKYKSTKEIFFEPPCIFADSLESHERSKVDMQEKLTIDTSING